MENDLGSVRQSGQLTVVDCLPNGSDGCLGGGGGATGEGGSHGYYDPTIIVVTAAATGLVAILLALMGVVLWCRIYRKRSHHSRSRTQTPPNGYVQTDFSRKRVFGSGKNTPKTVATKMG